MSCLYFFIKQNLQSRNEYEEIFEGSHEFESSVTDKDREIMSTMLSILLSKLLIIPLLQFICHLILFNRR